MSFNPGRNVGRVSIRVVPDTTQFRRALRRDLDRIARTMPMKVNINGAKVKGAQVRRDIERQLGDLRGLNVKVRAVVDGSEIDEVGRSLDKAGRVKVAPSMDRLTIERLRRTIQKDLRDIEVGLDASVNDRRLRQQLDHLAAAFERVSGRLANDILSPADAEKLRHRLNDIKDHIDHVARDREARIDANPFTAWATARLAWLTRPRTVELFVAINKKSLLAAMTTLAALSGSRLAWKWIDDLIHKAKELDRNLPAILGWSTGITSLVAALFAGTSGLVGVGQGLFSILPALLVLPGLFLNALGSATALIVALRNSSTELSVLKDEMHELGDVINDEFWGRARQPIIDLVTGLMPQLRNAFRDLSAGVGDFGAAMSKSFGKELAGGRLESIFKGIADGWRVLASGADGFAGAMVSLSQIAATYTPRLAGWFVRQANTFDKWLKDISEDGRLGRWMEDAIDSMYDLWDVTRGVAGIFEGIWRAADLAGSGGLDGFAKLMLKWRDVVNTADFQNGLAAVFRGSYDAMSAFGGAVSAIGRLVADSSAEVERFIGSAGGFFGGMIEGIFDALNSPKFREGLTGLSIGLDTGLEKILPHLQPIADTFGGFLGLLGDLAKNALPAATSVLSALMPTVQGLIDAIKPVLPNLADSVTAIGEKLGPALAEFVDKAGPALAGALSDIADILVELAPVISDLLSFVGDIVDALSLDDLPRERKKQFEASSSAPNPADFDNPIKYLEEYKRKAQEWADANPIIQTVRPQDPKLAKQMVQQWYEGVVGEYEKGGYRAASEFWNEYELNSLTPEVKSAIVEKLKNLGYDLEQLGVKDGNSAGGALGDGISDGLNSKSDAAKNAGKNVAGNAVSGANGVGGMYGIGQNLANGLGSGMRSRVQYVANQAAYLAGVAVAAAKREAQIFSPSKRMRKEVGAMLGEGVVLGIRDKRSRVDSAARGLVDFDLGAGGGQVAGSVAAERNVNLHIHNPVVKNLRRESWEAASMAGVLI